MTKQLALEIQLNEQATLSEFNWAGNELIDQQLSAIFEPDSARLFYLWGLAGCGKSHLLQACCHESSKKGKSSHYFPLAQIKQWGPGAIEGSEHAELIALDDIEAIADNKDWEEAIFHLYNRIRDEQSGVLIISGNTSPTTLPIKLPDLRSRLAWGMVLHINTLDEENKIKTLQLHAHQRGFKLSISVGQFLLRRCSRNMPELLTILAKLDRASLAAKRKITIPFAKQILNI
jgi:DnaA-homolog protein